MRILQWHIMYDFETTKSFSYIKINYDANVLTSFAESLPFLFELGCNLWQAAESKKSK